MILIACLLISLLPGASQARAAATLSAPTALLEILDKEDRDCVVTNGGLGKAVHVQSIQLAADRSESDSGTEVQVFVSAAPRTACSGFIEKPAIVMNCF